MSSAFDIVVCGSLVPDPLQTLEPVETPKGPGLKNELMLPSVLDPWAAHALYEAANLARQVQGSKIYLVSAGPKAKLQQLMMSIAQKVIFEFIAVDASASGFMDAHQTAAALTKAIQGINGLNKENMLIFGGCASASRDASVTMQLVGESLGIREQFLGVDALELQSDGRFKIKERVEGGQYLVSICQGPPALIGWATGNLPEPPNNPQIGMQNMRGIMPALQKAGQGDIGLGGINYVRVGIPQQKRETRIVKDMTTDQIAEEIVTWLAE